MHLRSLFRRFYSQCGILCLLLTVIFLPRIIAGEVFLHQAEGFESQRSFSSASLSFEDAARRLWWRHDLYERSGRLAYLAGENKIAIGLLSWALSRDGLTPGGRLIFGDLLFQEHDYDLAIDVWEVIASGFPVSEEASMRIAQTYQLLGNIDLAISKWSEIIISHPNNDQAFFNLGLLQMTTQPTKALPELIQAARLNPDLDGKVQSLRLGLNRLMLSDSLPYQLVISGQALATIGEWNLAEKAFSKAIDLANDYPVAWAWLGEANQHTGKDGLPALKKALDLDKNSALIWALNGLYYRRKNKTDQAWSSYLRSAQLEPDNSAWQLALGDLSAQKGELVDALGYYNNAVRLDPQDPNVWKGMSLFSIQYDMDVGTLGLNAALQLIRLTPTDWEPYNIMGQVLMGVGNLDSAKVYLLKSLKLSPDQPEIYLHLGYLLLMQDQRDAAYSDLVKATQLDPDGSVGWQAQRLLEQYFP